MNAAVRSLEPNGAQGQTPTPEAGVTRASSLRRNRGLLASAGAVVIALMGVTWLLLPVTIESTDDAYIGVDATTVAPKVRGLVAAVLVKDNQAVHAEDPLVKIDSEEFDAKVAFARADLAEAEAGVAASRAALVSLDAEESLARGNIAAAQTAIKSSDAQSVRAAADSRRYEALVASGSVAKRDADTYRAAAITAEQDVAHAEALLRVAQESLNVTAAKRAGLIAGLQKANAIVERTQSTLDLALQDQRHTLIRAPIDGTVGNRQVQQGDYVQAGTRLLTLVPLTSIYVTANFKETQTARMKPGERASIKVDALGGRALTGVVESLAPGSGSQFALLPFEPGTGNFTKIVQRVPVRIRFDAGQPGVATLRPGLSVTAKVTLER
jgi:membrane fusion protein (multidrug efflux system)